MIVRKTQILVPADLIFAEGRFLQLYQLQILILIILSV